MEFAGDKGKLIIRGSDMTLLTYTPSVPEFTFASANMWGSLEVKTETVELPTDVQTGHREIIRNFAQAVMTGVPVYCPGAEGLNSVEFINALILSGRTGRPVKVPVSRKKYDTFMEGLKAESKPKERVAAQTATDPKFSK